MFRVAQVATLCWNKAFWLAIPSTITIFNHSECFNSAELSYSKIYFDISTFLILAWKQSIEVADGWIQTAGLCCRKPAPSTVPKPNNVFFVSQLRDSSCLTCPSFGKANPGLFLSIFAFSIRARLCLVIGMKLIMSPFNWLTLNTSATKKVQTLSF